MTPSASTRRRNPTLFPHYAGATATDGQAETGTEAALQAACEQWLEYRGYWRRSQKGIEAGVPPLGRFAHIHQTRGNPLFLDLLITANDGRWLDVELKTGTGRVAKHQLALIAECPHSRKLVRGYAEFKKTVLEWENRPIPF